MFWHWVLPNKDTYFYSFSFFFFFSILHMPPSSMRSAFYIQCWASAGAAVAITAMHLCVHQIPELVHIFAVFSCGTLACTTERAVHSNHIHDNNKHNNKNYETTTTTTTMLLAKNGKWKTARAREGEGEKKKKFPHKLENTRLYTKTEYKMYIVCSFVLCLYLCISSLSVRMHIIAAAITDVAVCTYCSALHFHRMQEYLYRPWHATPNTKQWTKKHTAIKRLCATKHTLTLTSSHEKNEIPKNVVRWKLKYIKRNERKGWEREREK